MKCKKFYIFVKCEKKDIGEYLAGKSIYKCKINALLPL